MRRTRRKMHSGGMTRGSNVSRARGRNAAMRTNRRPMPVNRHRHDYTVPDHRHALSLGPFDHTGRDQQVQYQHLGHHPLIHLAHLVMVTVTWDNHIQVKQVLE